jgi:hypothetical protein
LFHAPAAICESGSGNRHADPADLGGDDRRRGDVDVDGGDLPVFDPRPRARPMAMCRVKSWAKSSSRL